MSEPQIDFDPSELRVNFSEKEAESEARDYTPVPTGKYHCAITEIETRFSNSEKNKGKPYWAVTLVVQNGPYADRKFWANVMLWDGALYSLAQLMKAVGRHDVLETGQIPNPDELLGEQVKVSVVKTLDQYKIDKAKEAGEENPAPVYKNEVKGFSALDGASSGSGASSLMP